MPRSGRFVAYLKRIPSDIRKLWREPLLLIGIILVSVFLFLFHRSSLCSKFFS